MNKRNYHLDNIKFILITLVVIGHFINPVINYSPFLKNLSFFIYTFHMPLFIYITGYFSKNFYKNKKININKIINYLILFIIFQIANNLMLKTDISLININNISWYIFATIMWLLTIPLINKFKPKYVLITSFIIALLSGLSNNINDIFALARIINFYPFFLLGYYTSKDILKKITDKKYIIPSIIILIVFIFICFNKYFSIYGIRPLLSGRYPYSVFKNIPLYLCPLLRLIYYPIVITISLSVMNIVPKSKTLISNLGSRSLQVYFLHTFIYRYFAIFNLYDPLMNNFKYWQFILIIISILCSIVLSQKIFEYPFKKFMNIKWKLKKSH